MFDKYIAGTVSPEEYEQSIPLCCSLRTFNEHAEALMLCWGLMDAIKADRNMNCGGCEYAVPPRHNSTHTNTQD